MAGPALRAGAWPAVTGVTGVAVVVGGAGIAFPVAAALLFPVCFALLAAAAAFTLDEPASAVVDVTPTGPGRRAAVRALALTVPAGAGTVLVLAGALRGVALPWPSVGVALAGSVLLGFALACVARRRRGEPGAAAASAAAFVLIAPGLLPRVARLVHTFPSTTPEGWSSDACWALLGGVCLAAIAAVLTERRPRARAAK
jgi:hypothetical protein